MIVALDHTVLVCGELKTAIADLTVLLGHPPVWTAETEEVGTALFSVDNSALELMAPIGAGRQADRLRQIMNDAGGSVLTSLVFASDQLSDDHRRFGRRGLNPGDVVDSSSQDLETGSIRRRKHFRLADETMAGIKTFVIDQPPEGLVGQYDSTDKVNSLDHLVVTTSNPERAVATYGGRLGLNLALDRTETKWGVRFLFFRVGGLTLEIVHKLKEPSPEQDQLWGITWAVNDLSAARARLDQAGVATSEIRTGRKPGSEVFTVKSHTLGIPTLFIAHQTRQKS